MSDSEQGSRVGSQIGPYKLRRLLGKGGMGEVYEAEDTVKDRIVALKLLPEGVIVRPMEGYGFPGYARVSVGTPAENERFIAAMEKLRKT